ncbi:type II CRISPR RNA-guided endonuclease Cas9 [uncultured Adlercreutzia sp.]|uniref:type II CRISPR RNA-guided endonuclease Cas9 n=1 Tax=uncultured Adlercreutzia sp. TaxID=875803 RepID=UPI0026F3CF7C|nr:type II CRISPR RNA-guided endonuclease Cas9 [uncultured Adlercreutzia sp.]
MATALSKAIVGYKADMANIFFTFGEAPEDLTTSIYLSNDEQVAAFGEALEDDDRLLFEAMQRVYSSYVLQGILSLVPNGSLSANKVEEYRRYGDDLRTLKKLAREYVPAKYDEFFRGPLLAKLYPGEKSKYSPQSKGYTRYNLAHKEVPYGDFKKEVEKLFKGTAALEDARYQAMMTAFGEGAFLRRLKTSDNGAIPFQLHLEEMNDIIEKQKEYYPFLEEKKKELNSLVSFRIPYYVGPLTQKNARCVNDAPDGDLRFAWAERLPGKENEKIYPWNWETIINKDESAERFIRRMTGTCSYLQGEPVLPKCSLLYEEFCVLNELNGARYSRDGDSFHRFDAQDRADMVAELFGNGRVTYKKIKDWMARRRGILGIEVEGAQGETGFESKLGSLIFFKKEVFNVDRIPRSDYPMIEEIILWNTIFEDRDILKRKLKTKYGDRLNDDQIRKICRKRFTGWGRLSEKFLTGIKVESDAGAVSLMDVMREGDPNNGHGNKALVLMEVLRDDSLDFQRAVDEINMERFDSAQRVALEELPGSPALRRAIGQALRIVDEIVNVAGHAPRNIFVEVTRSDNDRRKGMRTKRRADALKMQLEKLHEEDPEFWSKQVADELKQHGSGAMSEKLTLYFMQGGKSLYSGTPLNIARLSEYQVDHIIPQSYVKDDSFENKALVLAEENQSKSDQLLIPAEIRSRMAAYWRALHSAGLIGDKKYRNLMRSAIGEKQLKGFINRQLVETSQIVKVVQMLLRSMLPDTDVQPVKAELSSSLRKAAGLPKCREVNDFHHAHDALLASAIGRFVQTRYPEMYENPLRYQKAIRHHMRSEQGRMAKGGRSSRFPFIVESFMTSGFNPETGEIVRDTWNADFELGRLRKCFQYWQCYISRMPEETSGAFWNDTIYSPHGGKKAATIPLKKSLPVEKYGGYSGMNPAFFALLAVSDAKGRRKRLLEGVPVHLVSEIKHNEAAMQKWAEELAQSRGLTLDSILRGRLLKYTKIAQGENEFYVPALDCVYSSRQLVLNEANYRCAALVCDRDNVDDGEIDAGEILGLYQTLTDKCLVLCSRFAAVHKALLEGKERFAKLPRSDQRKLIVGLLGFYRASTARVDLTLIGGSAHAGKIGNGFLSGELDLEIIDQSVTGMFERRTRLGL